jgi:hypothetical protein
MHGVDEKDGDQESEHHGEFPKTEACDPVNEGQRQKKQRCGNFHSKVVPVDFRAAEFAFAFLGQIGVDGDVLPGGKLFAAGCAVRGGIHNRFPAGDAVDEDVKKAAQDGAQDSYDD